MSQTYVCMYMNMYVCFDGWIVTVNCVKDLLYAYLQCIWYVQILHLKNILHLVVCESTRKYSKTPRQSWNKHWGKNMEDGLPCHGKYWRQWHLTLPCHGDYWRQWQCYRHAYITTLPSHGDYWRQWQCYRHADILTLPCHGDYWRQWQCYRHAYFITLPYHGDYWR